MVSVIIIACKEEFKYTPKIVLHGDITYTDVFKGYEINDNDLIESRITSLIQDVVLPAGTPNKTKGSSYTFGPLETGVYEITSSYFDSVNNILYSGSEVINTCNYNELVIQNIELEVSEKTQLVKGGLSYENVLTENVEDVEDSLEAKVKSLNPFIEIASDDVVEISAPDYTIGPLSSGTYIFTFSFKDAHNIKHSVLDTFNLNKKDGLYVENYQLEIAREDTILVAHIVDTLNNGIDNVKVYLYNNYSLLEKYKSNSDAAVDTGITNNNGKVVFSGLQSKKYYIYGEKIIKTDTLHTLDTNFDSEKQQPLKRQINRRQYLIK